MIPGAMDIQTAGRNYNLIVVSPLPATVEENRSVRGYAAERPALNKIVGLLDGFAQREPREIVVGASNPHAARGANFRLSHYPLSNGLAFLALNVVTCVGNECMNAG
jgi:hypothetical protein